MTSNQKLENEKAVLEVKRKQERDFDPSTMQMATSADFFAMYRRLWNDYTPQDVFEVQNFFDGELIDFTQKAQA